MTTNVQWKDEEKRNVAINNEICTYIVCSTPAKILRIIAGVILITMDKFLEIEQRSGTGENERIRFKRFKSTSKEFRFI